MTDGQLEAKFLTFLSVHTQIEETDRETMAGPGPYKVLLLKGEIV